MKKVTLTDLNGKEIEVYFADDKTAKSVKHNDKYIVKTEDVPSDKNWFEMTGGNKNPITKENALAAGWDYYEENLNELDVNEGSAGEGAHENFYQKLNKEWTNKIKQLEQSKSQIKIDDTIPSDFIETLELRPQSIYKVNFNNFNVLAKFVGSFVTAVPDGNKILLQMKRHGTIFYVEEGSLMKATDLEVESYLEESN